VLCVILAVKALDLQKENSRLSQNNENLMIALNKEQEISEAEALASKNEETGEEDIAFSEPVSDSLSSDMLPLDQKTMGTIKEYAEQGKSFLTTLKAIFSDQFVLADEGRFYFKEIDPALRPYSYDDSKIQLTEEGIITYDDEDMDISYGIDVSQYNGEIDWELMKEAEQIPDFVYIRAGIRGYTSGRLVADTQVSANLAGARELGSEVGIYFVTQAVNEEEAREEARFVIETLSDNKVDLPIALDVEKVENYDTEPRTKNLSAEEYSRNVLAFADEMKQYGYETIVYGNGKTFMLMLDAKMLDDVDKWFADYVATDDYIPYFPYDFSIWQFSSTGHVMGITGDVDFNIRFDQPGV